MDAPPFLGARDSQKRRLRQIGRSYAASHTWRARHQNSYIGLHGDSGRHDSTAVFLWPQRPVLSNHRDAQRRWVSVLRLQTHVSAKGVYADGHVLALADSVRVNLEAYLFGALLTISESDLVWIIVVALGVGGVLLRFWNEFVAITVHPDIAEIEGTRVDHFNILLVLLIALTIAVSMKIVGVLLITSLLVIPAAAARLLSATPEQMAVRASLIGCVAVVIGLFGAFVVDVPVGPSIVVCATAIFLVLTLARGGKV